MSKKLEEKQRRREAEQRKKDALRKAHRRRNLITTAVAVLVAGAVIAAIVVQREDKKAKLDNYGVTADEANCGEVEEQDIQGAEHIETGSAHDPYTSNPPTSGPHYNEPGLGPVQTGFYEDAAEAPPEGVVHNLEHGQIVFYYNPDAPAEVIQDLKTAVEAAPIASVATPWPDIEGDANFVMTAWGTSQSCEQVSQEVVESFRKKFQGIAGP
ncbi:MAG: hypothetical protein QOG16_372, partial [Actinomycetota bacterium]|nr:hypothetical protein [Actinomycetota bacterium]